MGIFIICREPSPAVLRLLVWHFLYHVYNLKEFWLKVKLYFKFFLESLGAHLPKLGALIGDFDFHYTYTIVYFSEKVKLYFTFFSIILERVRRIFFLPLAFISLATLVSLFLLLIIYTRYHRKAHLSSIIFTFFHFFYVVSCLTTRVCAKRGWPPAPKSLIRSDLGRPKPNDCQD